MRNLGAYFFIAPFLLGASAAKSFAVECVDLFSNAADVSAKLTLSHVRNHAERIEYEPGHFVDAWVIDPVAPGAADGNYHPWNRRAWILQRRTPGFKVVYSPQLLDILNANAGVDRDLKIFLVTREPSRAVHLNLSGASPSLDFYLNQYETISMPHEWTHYVYFTTNRDHPLLGQMRALRGEKIGTHEGYSRYFDLTEHATFTQMFANFLNRHGVVKLGADLKEYGKRRHALEMRLAAREREYLKVHGLNGESLEQALNDPKRNPGLDLGDAVLRKLEFDGFEDVASIKSRLEGLRTEARFEIALNTWTAWRAQIEMFGEMVESSEKRMRDLLGTLRAGEWKKSEDLKDGFHFSVRAPKTEVEIEATIGDSGFGFEEGRMEIVYGESEEKLFRYSFQFRGPENLAWIRSVAADLASGKRRFPDVGPLLERLAVLESSFQEEKLLIAKLDAFSKGVDAFDGNAPAAREGMKSLRSELSAFWKRRTPPAGSPASP